MLAAPVVDKGARFNFPAVHPLDVTDGAREILQKADFILALDVGDLFGALTTVSKQTRESEYMTSPGVKIASISMNDMLVHSWANDFQALQAIDIPMCADTSVALPELTRLCRELIGNDSAKKATIEARQKELAEKHKSRRAKWLADAQAKGSQKDISTAWLALEIGEAIKREDWVCVNGTSNGWTRRLWDFSKPNQSLGGSGGAGLGYGPGASIGAALALKGSGKLAVAIQSDGDMLMTSSALWTAAKHRIPLLMVMHNNQSYYNSEEHGIEVAKFRKRAGGERPHRHPCRRSGDRLRRDGEILRRQRRRPDAQSGGPPPGHRARRQVRQRKAVAVLGRRHRRTALEKLEPGEFEKIRLTTKDTKSTKFGILISENFVFFVIFVVNKVLQAYQVICTQEQSPN